jgi:hypothetical protein
MKEWAIILGSVFLLAVIIESSGQGCDCFEDPNNYIEDPNALDNGLFECGDPNNLTPYGTEYNFNPPIYWERIPHPDNTFKEECFAGLYDCFEPPESESQWTISTPYEGESFVLLSTGGFKSKEDTQPREIFDNQILGSSISQKVYLSAGDTILGAYFFGTVDWIPYNDYGQIRFEMAGDPNNYPNSLTSFVIPESYCDVSLVGDRQSTRESPGAFPQTTDGWISFSYTIEPNQVGIYDLICEVVDEGDDIYNSYYALDGLRICKGGSPQGDLDQDCDVDLVDYSILSEVWMCFCPDPPIDDPNFPGDPNDFPPIPSDPNLAAQCLLSDLDDSWYVDANDLIIMTSEWMKGNSNN